jgi:hypothetical protein
VCRVAADPAATSDDYFGYAAAVSASSAIVGADGTNSGAGSAYVYVKQLANWPNRPTATLSDPTARAGRYTYFGSSVAVSQGTFVVGAIGTDYGAGAAYVFEMSSAGWPTRPTASLADPARTYGDLFGYSVAISDGTAVVGAHGTNTDAGAAYIYVRAAADWPATPTATLADPAATPYDYFGNSVAVISGGVAVVGAPGSNSSVGAAYIFTS